MMHSIMGFNHSGLKKLGLDYIDTVIVRWFIDFMATGKMKKINISGKDFYWLYYRTVLEQLILLDCKKQALSKRLKKICDTGLFEIYVDQHNASFYRINEEIYYPLIQKYEPPSYKSMNPLIQKYEPPSYKSMNPLHTKVGTIDSLIKDSLIKDNNDVEENSTSGPVDPSPNKEKLENPEILTLVTTLKNKIEASGTSAIIKGTHLKGWYTTFRLMVERDGRSVTAINNMLQNVFDDDFWSKNIRSADTLRKQWNSGKLDRLTGSQNLSVKQGTGSGGTAGKAGSESRSMSLIQGDFRSELKKYYPAFFDECIEMYEYPIDLQDSQTIWDQVERMKAGKNRKLWLDTVIAFFTEKTKRYTPATMGQEEFNAEDY